MMVNVSIILRIVGAIFFGYVGLRTGQYMAEGDTGIAEIVFWSAPPVLLTVFGAIVAPWFFLAVLAGKIIKDIYMAAFGDFSAQILGSLLGLG